MPIYSVRQIFQWRPSRDQKMKHVYEERITMWRAKSLEHAINKAEAGAQEYAKLNRFKFCGQSQAFEPFEDLNVPQGTEVFSLLRDSDLPPRRYIRVFFATGAEHDTKIPDETSVANRRRHRGANSTIDSTSRC